MEDAIALVEKYWPAASAAVWTYVLKWIKKGWTLDPLLVPILSVVCSGLTAWGLSLAFGAGLTSPEIVTMVFGAALLGQLTHARDKSARKRKEQS